MRVAALVVVVPVVLAAVVAATAMLLPLLIQTRASIIADGQPFCIQVPAGRFAYRPAQSWLDLTGFAMRVPFEGTGGSENYQWTFHAVLVSGGQFYNWSHRALDFVPVTDEAVRSLYLKRQCEQRSA